jgi:hypothetical protein
LNKLFIGYRLVILSMGSIGKGFLLLLLVILAVSSLMMVESAFAQTTEPSVPGSPGVGGFSVLVPNNVTTLGSPLEVRVVAFYPNGYIDTSFTGHVNFSASKGTIIPSTSGAFMDGNWIGLINLSEAGFDIIVYVNDGNGHTGKSRPISVFEQSPTPTSLPSSSSPNSTPTPTVPEFSSWTIPMLLTMTVALAGLSVYCKKHKQGKLGGNA